MTAVSYLALLATRFISSFSLQTSVWDSSPSSLRIQMKKVDSLSHQESP
ncbi:hypothetical protein V6Z12_A02G165600 [Gossypium hirsutum]